ncbi:hypothetical protein C8R44DRAFT_745698 [Mycena epipterygia]|nr:hypothetical protein C8R44DRAFT_745698 [Mycena epipterygia]
MPPPNPSPDLLADYPDPPAGFISCEPPNYLGPNFINHQVFSANGHQRYWLLLLGRYQGWYSTNANYTRACKLPICKAHPHSDGNNGPKRPASKSTSIGPVAAHAAGPTPVHARAVPPATAPHRGRAVAVDRSASMASHAPAHSAPSQPRMTATSNPGIAHHAHNWRFPGPGTNRSTATGTAIPSRATAVHPEPEVKREPSASSLLGGTILPPPGRTILLVGLDRPVPLFDSDSETEMQPPDYSPPPSTTPSSISTSSCTLSSAGPGTIAPSGSGGHPRNTPSTAAHGASASTSAPSPRANPSPSRVPVGLVLKMRSAMPGVESRDVAAQFELWSVARDHGLTGVDTLRSMRKEVTKFIMTGLKDKSGRKNIAMNYVQYWKSVVLNHGVRLKGWPLEGDPVNPTSIHNIESIRKVCDALKSGECFWYKMTEREKAEARAEYEDMVEEGLVTEVKRKERSDKNKRRKAPEAEGASTRSKDKNAGKRRVWEESDSNDEEPPKKKRKDGGEKKKKSSKDGEEESGRRKCKCDRDDDQENQPPKKKKTSKSSTTSSTSSPSTRTSTSKTSSSSTRGSTTTSKSSSSSQASTSKSSKASKPKTKFEAMRDRLKSLTSAKSTNNGLLSKLPPMIHKGPPGIRKGDPGFVSGGGDSTDEDSEAETHINDSGSGGNEERDGRARQRKAAHGGAWEHATIFRSKVGQAAGLRRAIGAQGGARAR